MSSNKKLFSFFPGCSLASAVKDRKHPIMDLTDRAGISLVEIDDWNCCGSSSAHMVDSELAMSLASRNLFNAPTNVPLVVACPSCNLRLSQTYLHLKRDRALQEKYENMWDKPFNDNLEILNFFEMLERIDFEKNFKEYKGALKGLKFVPYYGCMLARPPEMNKEKNHHGVMERILKFFGATPVVWSSQSKCCGTFLSVTKPDAVTGIINRIFDDATGCGAECLVTACYMCHMNLELRCTRENKIPSMHMAELLSVAMGSTNYEKWFEKHFVDPRPLLQSKGAIK